MNTSQAEDQSSRVVPGDAAGAVPGRVGAQEPQLTVEEEAWLEAQLEKVQVTRQPSGSDDLAEDGDVLPEGFMDDDQLISEREWLHFEAFVVREELQLGLEASPAKS